MKPLVSIIVPIYNGEKCIERCLASIRNQTYENIEVLVVDDGSRDHTEQILSRYEKLDARFHIIRKANTGVSDSRNFAIRLARGRYLQFADGDDWIRRDTTERFVTAMENSGCDMVISDYYRVVGHRVIRKGHINVDGVLTRKEFAEYMMKAPADFYYGVLWNKFFRGDIIRQNGLLCSTELDWCEDFRFNLEYLQYVSKICVLQEPTYYYVKTKGSLVDSVGTDFSEMIRTKKILFSYYKELYQSLDLYEKNRLRLQAFYVEFARDKVKRDKGNGNRLLKAPRPKKVTRKTNGGSGVA